MTGDIVKSNHSRITLDDDATVDLIGVPSVSRYRNNMTRRLFNYFLFTFFSFIAGFRLIGRNDNDARILLNISPPFAVLSGYFLSRVRRKASLILEVTDLPESVFELDMFNHRLIRSMTKRFYDRAYRDSDFIIPLTYGVAREIEDKGISREKIIPIPNWINDDEGVPDNAEEIRKKYGWNDDFIVMYTGGHGKAYDLMTLIKAAGLLEGQRGIRVVFFGDGEKKPEYMRYCEDRRIGMCEFHPPVPRDDLKEHLAAADVCVNLFYRGDFWKNVVGHKIIDYLEAGRAVIFCGVGETADIISRSDSGIVVEPENARMLSSAISRLIQDRQECRRMGERGRELLVWEYAREKMLRKLDGVLGID